MLDLIAFYILKPDQNGWHFANNPLKWILLNETIRILYTKFHWNIILEFLLSLYINIGSGNGLVPLALVPSKHKQSSAVIMQSVFSNILTKDTRYLTY